MKNLNSKTDYWLTSLAMMLSVLTAIALVDIAIACFGVEVLARMLGLQ